MPNYIYLDFGHRKLTKKAREYRHEVSHITSDMLSMNQRANHCLFICEGIVKVFGSNDRRYRVGPIQDEQKYFNDLLFELENFHFRLHAYRDKLCIFLNYVMKIGYNESDTDLLNKLMRNEKVRDSNILTELKKFKSGELQSALGVRKNMSHKIYYNPHNPLFIPNDTPKDATRYQMTLRWKKKLQKEVKSIDACMEKVFDINLHVTEKLIKYLNSQ